MTAKPSQTPHNPVGKPPKNAVEFSSVATVSPHASSPAPTLSPAPRTTPTVNFHVDRLVLHGFSTVARHQISAAMQAELSRLFQVQGIPRSLQKDAVINQFNGGDVEISQGLSPHIIGTRIARSLYRELNHD
ncbi:MAG: hypothetical protein AAFR58_18025 [Cyanobacteria bacterium J06627_28]